jgi:hypothetical protein
MTGRRGSPTTRTTGHVQLLLEGLPIPQRDKLPGQGAGVAVAWLGRRRRPRWTGAFIHRSPPTAVTRAVLEAARGSR